MPIIRRLLMLTAAGAAAVAVRSVRAPAPPAPDVAWWADGRPATRSRSAAVRRASFYITVRDGTRLAADVFLPADLPPGTRLPTVLRQTRYLRRLAVHPAAARVIKLMGLDRDIAGPYVAAGYAFVQIDVRGSGASFGTRRAEVGALEVADGADVVDWIVAQPWSDGTVGAVGISYEGTTSESLLRNQHPAVRAAMVRAAIFDPYNEAVPGGLRHAWFVDIWGRHTQAMDRNEAEASAKRLGGGLGRLAAYLTRGVAPVDDDPEGELLRQAVAEHATNHDITAYARQLEFRDEITTALPDEDDYTTWKHLDEIRKSGAALYASCGWYDGALPEAAIKRFHAFKDFLDTRLVLGPWDHSHMQFPDPTHLAELTSFDTTGQTIRFFDRHLRGRDNGLDAEPRVHYYTLGEGWKEADTFPPAGLEEVDLYLSPDHSLRHAAPTDEGTDSYQVRNTTTTGPRSRWNHFNMWGYRIGYGDRADADRDLLVYDTPPLEHDTEVTGFPIIDLFVASTDQDGAFHGYLEEVTPEGAVRHVTDAPFRAIHREVSDDAPEWAPFLPWHTFARSDANPLIPGEVAELRFHLMPISYLFRRGSRIRLALAGADIDNFARCPAVPPVWTVHRSSAHPSRLILPIVPR